MSAADAARELRELATQARMSPEFVVIDNENIQLFIKAADALEQAELQKDSAIAVSRRLQDEREGLLSRVEAALLGIKSVQSGDADEKDS